MTEAEAGLQGPPTQDPTSSLLQLLNLGELEGARTDEDIFMGPSQQQPRHRVFGGQVLAQSLVAGSRTVPEGRGVHSMHGYFLRPGDANKPITFGVQRLRDGRSFSARTRIPTLGSPKPMHPQIVADGAGKLAVAWDEVIGGVRQASMRAIQFDTAGQPVFGAPTRLGAADATSSYPMLVSTPAGLLAVYVEGRTGASSVRVKAGS